MQSAETVLDVIRERGRRSHPPGKDRWRAVCWETSPHRSGRGRRKRTRATGTSSAAYFTRRLRTYDYARELYVRLRRSARERKERNAEPSAGIIDSQSEDAS